MHSLDKVGFYFVFKLVEGNYANTSGVLVVYNYKHVLVQYQVLYQISKFNLIMGG